MTGDPLELMAGAARAAGIEPSRIVLPEDHEVELNGLRFHYVDWGNSHLPHVVLLHGGSLTAHTWDMSALLLRDSYHLVALDQRGHGDTDWTPNVEDDTGALMSRTRAPSSTTSATSTSRSSACRWAGSTPSSTPRATPSGSTRS